VLPKEVSLELEIGEGMLFEQVALKGLDDAFQWLILVHEEVLLAVGQDG
jgi:hypothetical protein